MMYFIHLHLKEKSNINLCAKASIVLYERIIQIRTKLLISRAKQNRNLWSQNGKFDQFFLAISAIKITEIH